MQPPMAVTGSFVGRSIHAHPSPPPHDSLMAAGSEGYSRSARIFLPTDQSSVENSSRERNAMAAGNEAYSRSDRIGSFFRQVNPVTARSTAPFPAVMRCYGQLSLTFSNIMTCGIEFFLGKQIHRTSMFRPRLLFVFEEFRLP